ncbi:uncharacterized protein EV420DRAFT_1335182 [Desarmillaria tabescens]|uniref:Uncharacterized protein n=1 Tax=Armillaria tabescens TaxID=1929756 RepID=A0AA39N561_ARMTA|nr:uncharacterized protein EV420DRAFT_1335182 [Desarmillaria tabescens]KAK0457804.1 hypothetical protein EV420DRAFT_1335182 [Desarmillaria tabescens]
MYYPRTRSISPPSSSPPSSPGPCIDSSPPSSPGVVDSEPESFHPSPHPYAGSIKATKRPPEYDAEKGKYANKRPFPQSPNDQVAKRRRQTSRMDLKELDFDDIMTDTEESNAVSDTSFSVDASFGLDSPAVLAQNEKIWEEAVNEIIDLGCGQVDLVGRGLQLIPYTAIDGLSKFFVPSDQQEREYVSESPTSPVLQQKVFKRNFTAPATTDASKARFETRLSTRSVLSLGVPREEIHLQLRNNAISVLPIDLFDLQKLTLLGLQQNRLTYIPPEIAHLENLRELNLSMNKLEYLPSEMLRMKFKKLALIGNPWKQAPDQSPRPVSETRHLLPHVIPFSELCLRLLFSPPSPPCPQTVLEKYYDLPLAEDKYILPDRKLWPSIGPHLKSVLNACVPGSVYIDPDLPYATGTGVCGCGGLFVQHAEERFTWESIVAGFDLGERAKVPVRWRGCQWGCLDHLEGPKGEEEPMTEVLSDEDVVRPIEVGQGELDFSDDET